MQLSLPIPVYTAPTASCAGVGHAHAATSTDSTAKNSAESSNDSFESLLKKDHPTDEPTDDTDPTDAEKAAAMAAALLWMPAVQSAPLPTLPVAPIVNSSEPTVSAEIDGADTSVCFATQSSRAFVATMMPLGSTVGESFQQVAPAIAPTVAFDSAENASDAAPVERHALTDDGQSSIDPETPTRASLQPDAMTASPEARPAATPAPASTATIKVDSMVGETGESPLLSALAQLPKSPVSGEPVAVQSIAEATPAISSNEPALADVAPVPAHKRLGVSSSTTDKLADKIGVVAAGLSVSDIVDPSTTTSRADGGRNLLEKLDLAEKLSVQEKNAALQPTADENAKKSLSAQGKYFLDAGRKVVTAVAAGVGTGVARINATMSAAASNPTKTVSISDPSVPFVFSGETIPQGTLTAEAPTPVSTVRETMAVILSSIEALERRADVQQKSVDLNLSVGNEKLGLRVELRDGTVHTTFRTESAETNAVLAHEWRSIVHPVGERGLRLAEPVFHSAVPASGESSFSSLGQGAPQQREHKAPTTFVSALKREFYDSGVTESAVKDSPAVSSSQLLNVLA